MFNLSNVIKKTLRDTGREWLDKEISTKFRKGRNITKAVELSILIEILEELKEIKAAIQGKDIKVEIDVDNDKIITETIEDIKSEDTNNKEENVNDEDIITDEDIESEDTDSEEENSVKENKEEIEEEKKVIKPKSEIKRINIQKKGKKKK